MGLPLVAAEDAEDEIEVFKFGDDVNVTHFCEQSNGVACDTGAQCNLTIIDPKGTAVVSNQPMTNNDAYHLFLLNSSDYSLTGVYNKRVECKDSILSGSEEFQFIINNTGTILDSGKAVIYLVLLAILIGVLGLTLYGSFKIPMKNPRNSFDEVIEINWFKYSKFFCMALTWMVFLWITFLVWNLAFGFLELGSAATAFRYMYTLVYAVTLPVMVFIGIIAMMNFVSDRNLQKLFDTGVSTVS